MVTRQTLVVVSVVLLATMAVLAPAVSAAETAPDRADDTAITQTAALQSTNETATAAGDESALGTQMTAFMQSNAAQAEDTVENGMWESAFERANESRRARMAQNRATRLGDRLEDLRERNQSLTERYHNGSIPHDEYVSEASRLSGQIEALEEGINGTAGAAERSGLNVSALEELETNARNMSGPEVAGVARGLTSGDRGPPEGVPGNGPPGDDGERPGGPPEDAPGGPEATVDGTVSPGNSSENGGGPGNASQGPGASGNGNDAGPGQDNGNPGASGSGDDNPGRGDDNPGAGNSGNDNPGQGNDAPGAGNSGTDAPGQSDDGPNDAGSGNGGPPDGAPGNSGPGDDDDANDDDDSPGDDGPEEDDADEDSEGNDGPEDDEADDESPGNDGQGDGGPGNSGQGNDDNPGHGSASLLTTDILLSH